MSQHRRAPSKRTLFSKPTPAQAADTNIHNFRLFINDRFKLNLDDYWQLHRWTCDHSNDFWVAVWDFTGIIGEREGYVSTVLISSGLQLIIPPSNALTCPPTPQ